MKSKNLLLMVLGIALSYLAFGFYLLKPVEAAMQCISCPDHQSKDDKYCSSYFTCNSRGNISAICQVLDGTGDCGALCC